MSHKITSKIPYQFILCISSTIGYKKGAAAKQTYRLYAAAPFL